MADVVVTWPKSRTLGSYLAELTRAQELDLVINFRIAKAPREKPERCYIVYDGFVRGYNEVIDVVERGPNEVSRISNDAWAGFWPAGLYLVRNPQWYPISRRPMRGFQGWRYYDR